MKLQSYGGVDPKNILELVARGRLKPISDKTPYLFEASDIKGFARQHPGPRPKPKPQIKKRFIVKSKSEKKGFPPDTPSAAASSACFEQAQNTKVNPKNTTKNFFISMLLKRIVTESFL